MKVWLDDRIVDAEHARTSVLDHGLLYGDGVFEGIRVTNGLVIDLGPHLERLQRSARAIHLSIPKTMDELGEIILQTARAHGKMEAYLRLLVTRGPGSLGLDSMPCTNPQVFCIADSIRLYSAASRARGLSLVTANRVRPDANMLDPTVKSLNYLNNVLTRREASERGADEALVLNRHGNIAEASAANVFLRFGATLLTPPREDGALPGITRESILRLAPAIGLAVAERSLAPADVLQADEAFLSGTGAGLVRVAFLDGHPVGGQDQRRLTPVLEELLEKHWLATGTPVPGLATAFGGPSLRFDTASQSDQSPNHS